VSLVAETRIETPDHKVEVVIPANALPPKLIGQNIEVEANRLDPTTLPTPPPGTLLIRGVEINPFINCQKESVTYTQPVTLNFPLTAADFALPGFTTSNLSVSRYDPLTDVWSALPVAELAGPPAELVVTVNTFSLFAVAIFQPGPATPATAVAPAPAVAKGPRGDAGAKGAVGDRGPAGPAGDRGGAGARGGVSVVDIIGLILAVVAVMAVGSALVRRRRTS